MLPYLAWTCCVDRLALSLYPSASDSSHVFNYIVKTVLWGRVFVSERGRLELTLDSTDWVLSYSWLDYCRHAGCPTECPWTCALCAERQVKMDSIVWVLLCSGNLCLCSFISNLTQFSENISDFLCFIYGTSEWIWGLVHTRQIAFYWVTASIQMFLK